MSRRPKWREYEISMFDESHDQIIDDDQLLAFAKWCRLNKAEFVYDPKILRRVFNAYQGLEAT